MKIKIELDDGYEQVIEVDEENDEIEDMGSTKEMMQARIKELEELSRDKLRDVDFYHEANMACMKEINALRDKAKGWEKRCEELEQELRDAQDRIHELDWTIAQYDDENRDLRREHNEMLTEIALQREVNEDTAKDMLYYKNIAEQYKFERDMLEDYGNCKPPKASLNDWAHRIHEIAVAHGWWETEDGKCDDGDRPFPEIVALCHSELSEALEEYRNYRLPYYPGENGKPEGVATEMIDCIIRILDWAAHEQVLVDDVMEAKVKYNEGREHRHGGKKA